MKKQSLALIGPYPLFGHRSLTIYQSLLLKELRRLTSFEIQDWTPTSPIFQHYVPSSLHRLNVAERALILPFIQARRQPVDIVHATSETAGFLLAASRASVKVCTFHDLADVDYVPAENAWQKLGRVYRQRNHRRSLGLSDAVATVSAFTRNRLVDCYGSIDPPIHVVPNPCRFADPDLPAPSHQSLSIAGAHKPYLFHVGSFPRKNRLRLLQAYAHAVKQFDKATNLVLCGRLNNDEARLLRELEISEKVYLLDDINDDLLRAYYQMAQCFVFPSLYEGFGLPVIEAQACGTPVLAADIPILREVGGDSCQYVPPTDVDAMAAKIVRVANDSVLRQKMADAGRRNVSRFTIEAWVRNHEELYELALERAAKRNKDGLSNG